MISGTADAKKTTSSRRPSDNAVTSRFVDNGEGTSEVPSGRSKKKVVSPKNVFSEGKESTNALSARVKKVSKGKKKSSRIPANGEDRMTSGDETGTGGGKLGKKAVAEIRQRLEKVENYLQERFNWLKLPKETSAPSRAGSLLERRRGRDKQQSQSPTPPGKAPRFKYVVDTS